MEARIVIVGTKHDGPPAIEALAGLRQGMSVALKREPDNQVDPGAVAVYCGDQRIGFLPRAQYSAVRDALDAGATVSAVMATEAIIQDGDIVPGGLPRLTVTIAEDEE